MPTPTPKEIREAFRDYRNEWQDIRDEAASDMGAISVEGPWSAEDRNERESNGRPCIHLDQINQFLNQTIGNVRKNKRAVKAIPKGDGANDQDAGRRSSLIMGIEERSKAQPIYLNAFECMIQRSYGYAVIRTEFTDEDSFDLEILIKPIMNPDVVLLSPDYKQPDASDIPDAFLIDRMSKRDFKAKYPEAKMTDFSGDLMQEGGVSDWVTEKNVQIAEYWKVEHDRNKLLLIETVKGQVVFTEDEWEAAKEAGVRGAVRREREINTPRVMQYMTNGLEILDEIEWAGSRIPIISCLGPERWVTVGGQAKRQLLSMVRFARDPQMLFDFLATQECEEAGMIPKTPFIGYKGQFQSDKERWEDVNHIPTAYLQTDLVVDGTSGGVLPKPERPSYEANFQQWEIAKDAASRSIQSGMGQTPIPEAAQRSNQKSGVALEKIDNDMSLGTFPFVDRYENCFLHNVGWQVNELITKIIDTEREMPVSKPDGKRHVLKVIGSTSHPINEQGVYEVQGLPPDHVHTGKGEFDVTISTGPSYQSEREEQSEFTDQLIENLPNLPQPGTPQAKVLALGVRMRPTLGPIGQQIADIFDPPDPSNLPPEAQAIVAQMQGKMQLLEQENAALHADRAGRVLEQQTKITLQQMKDENENMRTQLANDIKVLLAEISAKSQDSAERQQMYKEFWLENHGAAHEFAMQQDQQAHDHEIADKAAKAAASQQATQVAADQQAAAAQQQQPQT